MNRISEQSSNTALCHSQLEPFLCSVAVTRLYEFCDVKTFECIIIA
jgi:hypothetical protein